jgi:hypothetical protein
MSFHLRFYPPANALAIYDTNAPATDNDPMFNPLDHMDVIRFHSNLRYARFIKSLTVTGSTTIPARGQNLLFSGTRTLFAHGFGVEPVVFGRINSVSHSPTSGQFALWDTPNGAGPWAGSVPVFCWKGTDNGRGCGHFVRLGSTSSNVVMGYFGMNPSGVVGSGVTTINYTIHVLDSTINSDNLAPDPTKAQMTLSGSRITAGRGIFDTDYRYLKENGAQEILLPRGATMVIKGTPNAAPLSSLNQDWGWRYSINGFVLDCGNGSSSFAATFNDVGI